MVAAGKLTPAELRSSAWQRLFRDVYACAELPITHRVRALAASRLVVPDSTITGRGAAMLWGVLEEEPDEPIELTVPPGSTVTRVPGIAVRRRALDRRHVRMRDGIRTTSAEWTAIDLARTGHLDDAVVLLDQFVDAKVTILPDIAAMAAMTTGPGCRQVREAVQLADGLAGSPQETRLRVLRSRPACRVPPRACEGWGAGRSFCSPGPRRRSSWNTRVPGTATLRSKWLRTAAGSTGSRPRVGR
jgi:hypothetical protein